MITKDMVIKMHILAIKNFYGGKYIYKGLERLEQ